MRSPCRTGDGDGSGSTRHRYSSSYHDESRPYGGRDGAERPMWPLRQRPCSRGITLRAPLRVWRPTIGPR
eukprot:1378865-Prymnesium_polylepis.1